MAATNVTLTLSHIRNRQNRQNSSSRFEISNHSRTNSLSLHSEFLPFSCKFTSSSSLFRKPVQRWNSLQVAAVRKLEESELIPVNEGGELEGDVQIGKIPSAAGVYAIYNTEREVQFVGISRNVSESISAHAKAIPRLCSFVKVGIIDEPDRAVLTGAWKSWMEEHIAATGKVPPGNESGNTTFTRHPPKMKSDLRLTPGRGKELTLSLEELIDKLVKETEVVVFIKGSRNAPQCGFSQRVVGILNSHGVNYESVDVLDEEYNSGLRETLKQYSNWPTFPQVYVKGELIGGADILTSMAEKGELASVFGKS